jgi:hypothetical protein
MIRFYRSLRGAGLDGSGRARWAQARIFQWRIVIFTVFTTLQIVRFSRLFLGFFLGLFSFFDLSVFSPESYIKLRFAP